ncbi:unnamed protein product [Ceutorhynchus assimilis]|uniref:DUF7869 domain-containing protein n=1 Tax=Ceutorhynchus assimilis TaxID=467358 RepID=A0A9N9MYX8_9CUCU|nr:unnamed protein product [Ceutorhynchus assimilis]
MINSGMGSKRTKLIIQNAEIAFQCNNLDNNVRDDIAEDEENSGRVPTGPSNNKTSPGVLLYHANVLENPVTIDMDCLTDITPVTFFSNNGITAADNSNLADQANSSEKPVYTELFTVLDNSTVDDGVVENITEIASNVADYLPNQRNEGENCPDFQTVSTLEDGRPESGNDKSASSDHNNDDDPDYQPEDDDINAYDSDNEDNPLNAGEVENEDSDSDIEIIETEYTKKGALRKRKKYKYSVTERREKVLKKMERKHKVLEGCVETCRKKCRQNITDDRRIDINKQFWKMNRHDQKNFVMGCIVTSGIKRKTVGEDSRRSSSNKYYLKNEEGQSICICKTFFFTTLGYKKSNDKIIESIMDKNKTIITPKRDKRRGKSPPNKKNLEVVIQHIESFMPRISHYRREHAPLRKYLPSDLSAQVLYDDFNSKNPNFCSYDLYRSVLRKRNISFVKLGHEECEHCEHFNIHDHDKNNLIPDCDTCEKWRIHIKKAELARISYRIDAGKPESEAEVIFSVDLQKVIMLPRCEMFKSVIFTGRLVAYNESFVPVGSKNKNLRPTATIWHEAIRGRKKEDIISTFYKFFLEHRDRIKIVLWLDNCTAQNKNWAFLTFLVYIVNSLNVVATEIVINYFEPGHTFMSADSFHHQVEQSMRKFKKIYDFNDFKKAVSNANSSRVNVLEMELTDFFDWKDFSSKFKLKQEKVYLHDIVQIVARRGEMILYYKNDYEGELLPLNFLNAKILKSGIPNPSQQSTFRGISGERRNGIVNLIKGASSIIPSNRIQFWENIPLANGEPVEDEDNF